jgi:hypothetical protein
VPAALKLAGTSKNDDIRSLSLLPPGTNSGEALLEEVLKLLVKFL